MTYKYSITYHSPKMLSDFYLDYAYEYESVLCERSLECDKYSKLCLSARRKVHPPRKISLSTIFNTGVLHLCMREHSIMTRSSSHARAIFTRMTSKYRYFSKLVLTSLPVTINSTLRISMIKYFVDSSINFVK